MLQFYVKKRTENSIGNRSIFSVLKKAVLLSYYKITVFLALKD